MPVVDAVSVKYSVTVSVSLAALCTVGQAFFEYMVQYTAGHPALACLLCTIHRLYRFNTFSSQSLTHNGTRGATPAAAVHQPR